LNAKEVLLYTIVATLFYYFDR